MTVVVDERGEGHAVLTVRAASGDDILDNKSSKVRLRSQTPYRYRMRRSSLDPRAWVWLNEAERARPVPQTSRQGERQ
jgi:predicted transglutaminase-like cysteine proteinase